MDSSQEAPAWNFLRCFRSGYSFVSHLWQSWMFPCRLLLWSRVGIRTDGQSSLPRKSRVCSTIPCATCRGFLAEAFLLLVLFLLLLSLYMKGKCKGRLMLVYLSIYAVIRFTLEFFRGDEIRGHLWIFSTSQWISLLTLLVVIIYLVISNRKRRQIE